MRTRQLAMGVILSAAAIVAARSPATAAERPATTRASGGRRPVLDHGIAPAKREQYVSAASRAMDMPEEEWLALLPDQTPCHLCECPNCYGGTEGWNIFEYDSGQVPRRLECKHCGQVVYPSGKFPEDQVMQGRNALGETITYRYYHGRAKNCRHFLGAHLQHQQRTWLIARCIELGKAYQATGDDRYARRAILILDKIARVYPRYPAMVTMARQFEFVARQAPPYPWNAGRWARWPPEAIPEEETVIYDLVYDSVEFDRLSQVRGYDVRKRLETDFFADSFDSNNTPPMHPTPEGISEYRDALRAGSELATRNLRRAMMMGRVLGEPRYFHWGFGWLKAALFGRCFRDGMWHLAPSYHYQLIADVARGFDVARGYCDPPGYVDPFDGQRYDNLDPAGEIPFLAKALRAPEIVGFPNGCSTPVHDTWANEKNGSPRARTVSTILPGYGHVSLGRGEGPNQMQVQLHFSGAYGHAHLDNLNLILFAKEREMLADLGYTHTELRPWCTSTLGHNTVVVDGADQRIEESHGDLLWFFPDTGGVAVTEADGRRAYANIAGLTRYRRLLAMVPVSPTDAYVVDIFRVTGGRTHDWAMHGSADEDMAAACDPPLATARENLLEPGRTSTGPAADRTKSGYDRITEIRSARTDRDMTVTWTCSQSPDRGVRIHLSGGAEREVMLGRSPSVRRAKEDVRRQYDFHMPQIVVRRSGAAPLASQFVAVEEPFAGRPFITRVTPVAVNPPGDGLAALQVAHGTTVDTIISTLDDPPYAERATADGVRIQGRLGIVRRQGDRVVGAWLFDGCRLTAGPGWVIELPEAPAGEIESSLRKASGGGCDGFVTDAVLPAGDSLRGVWMIVTDAAGNHHGHKVDHVESRGGSTVIVTADDHGMEIAGGAAAEVYFPQRTTQGRVRFTIPLSATRGPAADRTP